MEKNYRPLGSDPTPLGALSSDDLWSLPSGTKNLWFVHPQESLQHLGSNPIKIDLTDGWRLKKHDIHRFMFETRGFTYYAHYSNGGFYWLMGAGFLFWNFWHAWAFWQRIKYKQ